MRLVSLSGPDTITLMPFVSNGGYGGGDGGGGGGGNGSGGGAGG